AAEVRLQLADNFGEGLFVRLPVRPRRRRTLASLETYVAQGLAIAREQQWPDWTLECCVKNGACYGFSHRPDSHARNTASITAMFAIASSRRTGTSPPSRTARENAFPCSIYWSQIGIVSIRIPPPKTSRPSSIKILVGRSGGALNGISISIRPVVPRNCIRW